MTEEDYGNIKIKYMDEGLDYYILHYTNGSEFAEDLELTHVFKRCEESLNLFINLVNRRIKEKGGDPEEWVL